MPGIATSRTVVPFSKRLGSGSSWTQLKPILTLATINNNRIDIGCVNAVFDAEYLWERKEPAGEFQQIGITGMGLAYYSDTTVTSPILYEYRARALKNGVYTQYSDIVVVPIIQDIRINSANSSLLLADANNEFYFNNGAGSDLPFSVLAIAYSNNLGIINTLLSRGDANGCSYNLRVNNSVKKVDFVIYGSDSTTTNLLYCVSTNLNYATINKIAYTYSGSKAASGMKLYLNNVALTTTNTKYGTYTNMNNRAGLYVGRQVKDNEQGNFDLYALIICNKELSVAEITEFQAMETESDISSLSFYANVKSVHRFENNLNEDLGNHNVTSVAPAYINYKPNYLPARVVTSVQQEFNAFKLGWFICYGIETYNGDENDGKTVPVSLPSVFAAPSIVDVHAWAILASSYNKIDYAILTVNHIYGFSLHDHKTAQWRGEQIDVGGGLIVPTYTKYDTGVTTSDKGIVTKFITEFNNVGIKPILYYCLGYEGNWQGDLYTVNNYTDPNYQFDHYLAYLKERLQELARLNPFMILLDMPIHFPVAYLKELYYAIKIINPSIGVTYNSTSNKDNTDNSYFPFDSISTEEYLQPALPSDAYWQKTQTYNGVTYPVSKGLVLTSRENAKWFYKTSPSALRPLSELQGEYDYAKTANIPCAISINPKLDGVIDQAQADLIGGITL